ncbi:M23 family metallopeptidase [Parendozoicomonas haliclonae]|uniref:Murein DD-endopeptidase MepM n=1 Tax=Parendozoicomonas haliclonae TaxID=1960125 RepID=A0A1X7AKA7_9GAMM|nr:M23 family metallopeptidase [Parendozoicomonas haliclonae]SMA47715.1 Murein DD-endopeptidase MepM [Parendozoicomonas haliclonae]
MLQLFLLKRLQQTLFMTLISVPVLGFDNSDKTPSGVQVLTEELVLMKGEALWLQLPCPASRCEACLENQPLNLFPSPLNNENQSMALIATPLDGESCYTLKVRKKGRDWQDYILTTEEPDYPEEALSVNPDMVKPPEQALERIQRERKEIASALNTTTQGMIAGAMQLPVPLQKITSPFGIRRLYNGTVKSRHTGVDLRAAEGTPVQAPQRGIVRMAQNNWYTGGHLILDHGLGITTSYFHLSELLVNPGDEVKAGQLIAKTGATGRVTGPHLHWGVHIQGVPVNPLKFVEDLNAFFLNRN